MWCPYLSSFSLPPSKTWCPWPYRGHTLAFISNHASVSSPLSYTLTSPFPFPSFLSSFLFFLLPCIPFLLPCNPGSFTWVASRNTRDGRFTLPWLQHRRKYRPPPTNSQQPLWKGLGLSDPQWDLEGPVLSRCGAGTHSCLDCFLNICCQPQSSESTDCGLPKRKARPIWHSACKGQDPQ